MKSNTEALWRARVTEWRESGRTAQEFAAGKPFKASTLTFRASQLRRGEVELAPPVQGGAARRRRRADIRRAAPAVKLAEVVRRRVPVEAAPVGELTVDVAGVRLQVRKGFDSALLRDVVRALKERP